MTKKRKAPGKSVASPEDQDEALTHDLLELARELALHEGSTSLSDALKKRKSDFRKIIRKCLNQKKDDVLNEALERALELESHAYPLLKETIEDTSENVIFRRDDGRDLEINAFVIPLFAHTAGGLDREQCFQDEEAFDLLRQSIHGARLESPDANVVLVSHAYHLDEIEQISHSQLNAMVHEAFDSMTRKKATAAPEITRSMSGWPDSHFAPEDQAVELRFLLGFALKTLDDPFYQVPKNEAAADRYFETRADRFRRWTKQAAPLVKRCLATDGREMEIDFLYQDLFYGGKERGIAEYDMLQMMSELHHGLHLHGTLPDNTRAIIGPVDAGDAMALRVNLYAEPDGALVASSDKPIAADGDLEAEADDVRDALMTIGVKSLSLARKFDADGQALDARPYKN